MKRLPSGKALSAIIAASYRSGPKVAIDCSLQEYMSDKEIAMAAQQTQYAFAANLRSPTPLFLHLTGLLQSTRLHRALSDTWRGFSDPAMRIHEQLHHEVHPPHDIVYLSPDSENVLDSLDDKRVYVIGGLVDLAIMKRLTQFRATQSGLYTARLPVKEHMKISANDAHHLNLPINLVVKMLISLSDGNSWPQVLHEHFPKRKGYSVKLDLVHTLRQATS